MHKLATVLLRAALIAAPQLLNGTVIVADSFDYAVSPPAFDPVSFTDPDGLRGKNGGTGNWTGAYTQEASRQNARIGLGSLTYSDGNFVLDTAGSQVNTTGNSRNFRTFSAFTLSAVTPEFWMAFIADASSTGAGHAGVALFNGGTEIGTFGKGSPNTTWGFSGSGQSTVLATTQSFLVYKFVWDVGGNATGTLWVDPDLDTAPTGTGDAQRVLPNFTIDNLRISSATGNTMVFDSVDCGSRTGFPLNGRPRRSRPPRPSPPDRLSEISL
jgi:hypothetical protein